jgi:hypothetical protein
MEGNETKKDEIIAINIEIKMTKGESENEKEIIIDWKSYDKERECFSRQLLKNIF